MFLCIYPKYLEFHGALFGRYLSKHHLPHDNVQGFCAVWAWQGGSAAVANSFCPSDIEIYEGFLQFQTHLNHLINIILATLICWISGNWSGYTPVGSELSASKPWLKSSHKQLRTPKNLPLLFPLVPCFENGVAFALGCARTHAQSSYFYKVSFNDTLVARCMSTCCKLIIVHLGSSIHTDSVAHNRKGLTRPLGISVAPVFFQKPLLKSGTVWNCALGIQWDSIALTHTCRTYDELTRTLMDFACADFITVPTAPKRSTTRWLEVSNMARSWNSATSPSSSQSHSGEEREDISAVCCNQASSSWDISLLD